MLTLLGPLDPLPSTTRRILVTGSSGAGKSTLLLQASYNYRERGMTTLLLIAALDTRAGPGRIASRIGISDDALAFGPDTDLFDLIRREGLDGVTIRNLSRQSGWSSGAIRHYLPTHDSILTFAAEQLPRAVEQALRALPLQGPPQAQLESFLLALLPLAACAELRTPRVLDVLTLLL